MLNIYILFKNARYHFKFKIYINLNLQKLPTICANWKENRDIRPSNMDILFLVKKFKLNLILIKD